MCIAMVKKKKRKKKKKKKKKKQKKKTKKRQKKDAKRDVYATRETNPTIYIHIPSNGEEKKNKKKTKKKTKKRQTERRQARRLCDARNESNGHFYSRQGRAEAVVVKEEAVEGEEEGGAEE